MEASQSRFVLGEPGDQLTMRLLVQQQEFSSTLDIDNSDYLRLHIWQKLCITCPTLLLTMLTHSFTADIVKSPSLARLFVNNSRDSRGSLGL